ncbi:MAG: CinA family protein, partial [Eubacterium sp.]
LFEMNDIIDVDIDGDITEINILGVQKKTIDQYGAVSSQCVEEMAQGARKLMGTTYAIATSGIAGPGGGTPEKPVGTVWIAVAGKYGVKTLQMQFRGDRKLNIERFASNALYFFRLEKLNKNI